MSIVKIESNKLENKLNRFRKIAKEAAEQSHRNTIPEVIIITNKKQLDFSSYDVKLLLDEEEAKKIDGRLLIDVNLKNTTNVVFVVGPEGGIAPEEVEYLMKQGFVSVGLGPRILRTETVVFYVLSTLSYEWELK